MACERFDFSRLDFNLDRLVLGELSVDRSSLERALEIAENEPSKVSLNEEGPFQEASEVALVSCADGVSLGTTSADRVRIGDCLFDGTGATETYYRDDAWSPGLVLIEFGGKKTAVTDYVCSNCYSKLERFF